MDNKSSQSDQEYLRLKFLEASKASILVPHLFLAEAMATGVFLTLETTNDSSNYLVLGIRPNLTAMLATYAGKRLLSTFVQFDKEKVEINSQLYIFDCDTEDLAEMKWPDLVDQTEEWAKGDREEINLMDE
jgi:hypothetical protein